MKDSAQTSSQKNSRITISPDTIEYYMQKSQQQRNDSIAGAFNGFKSRINCFFVAFNKFRDQ